MYLLPQGLRHVIIGITTTWCRDSLDLSVYIQSYTQTTQNHQNCSSQFCLIIYMKEKVIPFNLGFMSCDKSINKHI